MKISNGHASATRASKGHWRCVNCGSHYVLDRTLVVSEGRLEVHRLTCERCHITGHYDCDVEQSNLPTFSINGMFRRVGRRRRAISLNSSRPIILEGWRRS